MDGTMWIEALGLDALWNPYKRIYYPYIIAALLWALGYYWLLKKSRTSKSLQLFWTFLFPKKIWLHPSALVDYQLFIFNNLLKFFLIAPYLMAHGAFAYVVVRWWDNTIGVQDTILIPAYQINIAYTIVFLLLSDFSRFFLHYCLHKIPFLWQFHKVHHAAEVMTPITLYRIHPLEYFLFRLRSLVVFGLVAGSFFFWFRTSMEPWTVFQIHIGIFVFNLLGANLRHSHIPISFGKRLEHVFISPAQHQIHHGKHTRYYDKNFGSLFAWWDWLFGTLHISNSQQKIAFGIEEEEQYQWKSLGQNLYMPLVEIWRKIFR